MPPAHPLAHIIRALGVLYGLGLLVTHLALGLDLLSLPYLLTLGLPSIGLSLALLIPYSRLPRSLFPSALGVLSLLVLHGIGRQIFRMHVYSWENLFAGQHNLRLAIIVLLLAQPLVVYLMNRRPTSAPALS